MRNSLLKTFIFSLSSWMLLAMANVARAGTHSVNELNAVDSESDIIYGALIFQNGSFEDINPGIYSIPVSSTDAPSLVIPLEYLPYGGGIYLEGKYYVCYRYIHPMSGTFVFSVAVYDMATKELVETRSASNMINMAYDKVSDQVYVVTMNGNGAYMILNTYDLETGYITPVGQMEHVSMAMAFDAQGQLYSISGEEEVFKVNKENAETTQVGALGIKYPTSLQWGMAATFDQTDNRLYFAAYLLDGTSGLYEVNTTNGQATLKRSFPNNQQYTSLFFDNWQIGANVPATISGVSFLPDSPGGLNGKISFIVSDKTYEGAALAGTVDATVYIDTELLSKQTGLTPGQEVVIPAVAFKEPGYHKVRVVLSNTAGEGETFRSTFWVGNDTPLPVENLQIAEHATGVPVLSWDAPGAIGKNGGYVDPGAVTYKIVRLSDNEVVEEAYPQTTYVDNSINRELMTNFYYSVTPQANGLVGDKVESDGLILGPAFTVPYYDALTQNTFKLYTVVDANEDGNTWTYSYQNAAQGPVTNPDGVDDWLFTPPIEMEAGAAYTLSYQLNFYNVYNRKVTYKVTFGKSLNPADHTEVIADFTDIISGTARTVEHDFIIPATDGGVYYIGFHLYGDYLTTEQTTILINQIALSYLAHPEAPNVITNLVLKPGDLGMKRVSFNFTAPTINVAENTLSSATEYKIYRNGSEEPVEIFNNRGPVSPGASMALTDQYPEEGMNYYRILIANEYGDGLAVEDSVYVGLDLPGELTALSLRKDESANAAITWSQPAGLHGGYLDLYTLLYKIERNGVTLEEAYEIPEEDITRTVSGPPMNPVYTHTYVDNSVTKDEQEVYKYTITPYYSEEKVGVVSATNKLRFGTPYTDFKESFAGAAYENRGWDTDVLSGAVTGWGVEGDGWILTNANNDIDSPQDRDGGMALFQSASIGVTNTRVRLASPMINLNGFNEPLLRFWFYHTDGSYSTSADRRIEITVAADNNEFELIKEILFYIGEEAAGWTQYNVSLADYKDASAIVIGFEGVNGHLFGYNMAIDNISVIETPLKDLNVLSFTTSDHLISGGYTSYFHAQVKNFGMTSIADYTMELYKEDALLSSLPGVEIAAEETINFTFEVEASIAEIGTSPKFYVKANLEDDEVPENNVSDEIEVIVIRSPYPSVMNLEGAVNEDHILLDWDQVAAANAPLFMKDDFEEYPTYIIDGIGEWTVYDGDGIATWYHEDVVPYANRGLAMAYQVYTLKVNSLIYSAHSGEQMLSTFTTTTSDPNNDWLISPVLNGSAQTISFYARGIYDSSRRERFIVYASSTDQEIENFVKVSAGNYVEATYDWKEYRYDLPEGSKYFAIRCVSENVASLLIDDISFMKKGEETLTLLGYDVYRDGVKLNDEPVHSLPYQDNNPVNGANTYMVTAVYEEGVSNYSDAVTLNFGTNSIDVLNSSVNVFTGRNMILVEGVENNLITLMTVDGKLVYNQIGNGYDRIEVNAGIYLVKIGNTVSKVIVR